MTNIITAKEIRKAFTDKVNEYLKKGMEISVGTMSGSQGEISKIDLTDGTRIYRIRLERNHNYIKDDFFYGRFEDITLTVESYPEDNRDVLDTWSTLWNGKGDQIEVIHYYSIKDNEAYTDDYEEIKRICGLRNSRRETRSIPKKTYQDKNRISVFYGFVKTQKGFSSVTKKQIEKVTKVEPGNYTVYFTKESKKHPLSVRFR